MEFLLWYLASIVITALTIKIGNKFIVEKCPSGLALVFTFIPIVGLVVYVAGWLWIFIEYNYDYKKIQPFINKFFNSEES